MNLLRLRWPAALAASILLGTIAAPAGAQDRVDELARQVDALSRELERLRLGEVGDTTAAPARGPGGVGAAKVYGAPRGISIGGYGDLLYENFDRRRENDAPSGALDRLDFLRQVFYIGYKFDETLLFNSEVEIEHGGVQDEVEIDGVADPLTNLIDAEGELSGEVVLEFAYVEWAPRRAIGARAGMLLAPVGLVNELHEPPFVIGARRPEVENRILPTTWRGNGVGLFGALPFGFAWRAYLLEGLDARGFSAANALRGGRQSGSRSLLTQPAFSGRLDWTGGPGLLVGASVFTGESWQAVQPAGGGLRVPTTVADAHLRWQWSGIEVRGLYVHGRIGQAGALSNLLELTDDERIGRRFWGAYGEASVDVLPWLIAGTRYGLLPYGRFERYDTQVEVADGPDDPALEITVATAGLAFKPHPNVVVKGDRQWRSNRAESAISQWNLALGYVF